MKLRTTLIITGIILIAISISNCQITHNDFPILSGSYLGQEPPTDTPKKFLPEIFKNIHSSPVFSPDGKQVYWRSMDYKPLRYMEEVEGKWTNPRSVPFITSFFRQDAPFITQDCKRLFFISTKPQKWYQLKSDEGIWYVEKKGNGWSSPKLACNFYTHWSFSISNKGNLYIGGSEDKEHDIWSIYKVEYKDGRFLKPIRLDKSVNLIEDPVVYGQASPFIAPDESYLIFSRRVSANDQDLFISFQNDDGTWTDAVSLGDKINSKGYEICPMVTPDGKYLFYMRRDCVMWVSTKMIENLRPKEQAN